MLYYDRQRRGKGLKIKACASSTASGRNAGERVEGNIQLRYLQRIEVSPRNISRSQF